MYKIRIGNKLSVENYSYEEVTKLVSHLKSVFKTNIIEIEEVNK